MISTHELRETLEAKSESFDISVSALDDIAGTARRRTRRSQLVGGMSVAAVALFMFLGLGTLGTQQGSSEMFAGLSNEELLTAPSQVIKTSDGWLGAVIVGEPIEEGEEMTFGWDFSGEVYVTTSDDGEKWELARPTGLRSNTSSFAIDEHDGVFWLALSGEDGPYVASSSDLEEWTVAPLPASPQASEVEIPTGMLRSVEPQNIVATDTGVMVLIEFFDHPDLEAIGADPSATCGLTWSRDDVRVRTCGTTDWQDYEIDIATGPTFAFPHQLAYSVDGESFENREIPPAGGYSGPQVPRLFESDGAFAVLDTRLHTSADGRDWERVAGVLVSPPAVVAERNGSLLVANSRMGTSTDLVLQTPEGERIGTDLSELLGEERDTDLELHVRGAVAGEAGWLVYGDLADRSWQRSFEQTESFSAIVGDYTITGTRPGGAAQLRDPDGDIVYEWDEFEADMPARTSARFEEGNLVFVDADGNELARTTYEDWHSELGNPTTMPRPIALFSSDGVNWTDLETEVTNVVGGAVGDDEVLLVNYGPLGPVSTVIEVGVEDN